MLIVDLADLFKKTFISYVLLFNTKLDDVMLGHPNKDTVQYNLGE